MPIVMQVICDVCGRVKKESNHWFAIAVQEPGLSLLPLEALLPPLPSPPSPLQAQVCCSQACAFRIISKWMDLQTGDQQASLRPALGNTEACHIVKPSRNGHGCQ